MAVRTRYRSGLVANHARQTNPTMAIIHEKWAARVLGMHHNSVRDGPDIYDDCKVGEVKFHLLNGGKSNYIKWTGQKHQKNYNTRGRAGYWVLGTYHVKKPYEEIDCQTDDLESLVYDRSAYIVTLDWAKRYRASHVSGETRQSKWEYWMFYLKFNDLPNIVSSRRVDGGILHFTQGTNPSTFSL